MKKKKFNQFVNNKFFDNEPNELLSWFYSKKFPLQKESLALSKSYIFICNKMTKFDRFLISRTIVSDFVFLKDSVVLEIKNGTLSKKDASELFSAIKKLRENDISIAILPEETVSIFGKTHDLNTNLTSFLFDTGLDLKFMNFAGAYYSYPIWAPKQRKCETYFHQQKNISHESLVGYNADEINNIINSSKLSSASVYADKYPINIVSNNLASGIERIMYACPSCKELFSLYSEYGCLKCKSCLNAIEFSANGDILFSSSITKFDDIEDFLFNTLSTRGIDKNELICYENIIRCELDENHVVKEKSTCSFRIFSDRIEIESDGKVEKYSFSTIQEILLDYENTVFVKLPKNKTLVFRGKNNENFYILCDLDKLNLKE